MYMTLTEQEVSDSIVTNFTSDSMLRVIVSTIDIGIGINCSDVCQVIHYGFPNDLMFKRLFEQDGIDFKTLRLGKNETNH